MSLRAAEVSRTDNKRPYRDSVIANRTEVTMKTNHSEERSGASLPLGLAARLGNWSAEHRKKAIFGWIALLLVALVAGSVGAKTLSAAGESNGDSARAERLLEHGGFKRPAAEQVLLQVRGGGSIRTRSGEQAARDVIAAITATKRVKDVRSPFAAGNAGQISRGGRSALVLFSMKGMRDTA